VPISKLGLQRASWARIEFAGGGAHIRKPIDSLRIEPNRTKSPTRTPGFECITRREDGNRECYDSPVTGVAEITRRPRAEKRRSDNRPWAIRADQHGSIFRASVREVRCYPVRILLNSYAGRIQMDNTLFQLPKHLPLQNRPMQTHRRRAELPPDFSNRSDHKNTSSPGAEFAALDEIAGCAHRVRCV
jgi:hypothetical protein